MISFIIKFHYFFINNILNVDKIIIHKFKININQE